LLNAKWVHKEAHEFFWAEAGLDLSAAIAGGTCTDSLNLGLLHHVKISTREFGTSSIKNIVKDLTSLKTFTYHDVSTSYSLQEDERPPKCKDCELLSAEGRERDPEHFDAEDVACEACRKLMEKALFDEVKGHLDVSWREIVGKCRGGAWCTSDRNALPTECCSEGGDSAADHRLGLAGSPLQAVCAGGRQR
jgi:hypothetical protein